MFFQVIDDGRPQFFCQYHRRFLHVDVTTSHVCVRFLKGTEHENVGNVVVFGELPPCRLGPRHFFYHVCPNLRQFSSRYSVHGLRQVGAHLNLLHQVCVLSRVVQSILARTGELNVILIENGEIFVSSSGEGSLAAAGWSAQRNTLASAPKRIRDVHFFEQLRGQPHPYLRTSQFRAIPLLAFRRGVCADGHCLATVRAEKKSRCRTFCKIGKGGGNRGLQMDQFAYARPARPSRKRRTFHERAKTMMSTCSFPSDSWSWRARSTWSMRDMLQDPEGVGSSGCRANE